RARRRSALHCAGAFHALHRQGPLGTAAPRAGGREPVLRRCGDSDRRDAARPAELRPRVDRRSVGNRARAGAGRGDRDHGRARPIAARGHPRALPVAREPSSGGIPLAVDGVTPLRAVLFDVDFTLCRPGPELGPQGYAALGREYGLDLDPARYDEARLRAIEDLRQHPELDHDEEIWTRFTEDIVRGMGGAENAAVGEIAGKIVRRWEQAAQFELYDDVLPTLRELRRGGLRLGLISNTS